MEAKLIITLDDNFKIYQTLETMELQELDAYMIQHFENSNEIRIGEKYKKIIQTFLDMNQVYRNACSKKNNGFIRVVYTDNDGMFQPLKAYYKKDKHKLNRRQVVADIKKRIREDESLLKSVRNDKTLKGWMSPYCKREIDSALRWNLPKRYREAINTWVGNLAKGKNGYFCTRVLDRYTEKYCEQHQKETQAKKNIPIAIGTIRNVDPFLLTEDMKLHSMSKEKVEYYENAQKDPEELFSLYSLEEIDRMKNVIEPISSQKQKRR